MTDIYIIAAGRGSRMGGSLPKALVPITDAPCLTTTLQQIGSKFANVIIVTNTQVQAEWDAYYKHLSIHFPELCANLHFTSICSGLGDGHAVLAGMKAAELLAEAKNLSLSDDVVISWGDVFFPHSEIIDELLSKAVDGRHTDGLVPAVIEQNPYVTLLVDAELNLVSADFSKYGECHPSGFHDQSVFRFFKSTLIKALDTLHSALWKNGRYITPGGELSLLYVFHYLYSQGKIVKVYETDYPTLSFNTPEEVAKIQQDIDTRWKCKFRNDQQ